MPTVVIIVFETWLKYKQVQTNSKSKPTNMCNKQKSPRKEEEVAEVHEEAPCYVGLAHITRHPWKRDQNDKNEH